MVRRCDQRPAQDPVPHGNGLMPPTAVTVNWW